MYQLVMKYWRSAADREAGNAEEVTLRGGGHSLRKAAELMGSGMQVNAGTVHLRLTNSSVDVGVAISESPDCRNLGLKVDTLIMLLQYS
jgi:hypothetical protein